MRKLESLSKEEEEILVDMVFRQLNAGIAMELVKSNIRDQYVDSACADYIVQTAHQRCLEKEKNTPESSAFEGIKARDLLISLLCGLGGAILGGVLWAIIAIITRSEFLVIYIIIGLLAGLGTYEFIGRRNFLVFRVLAAFSSCIGIISGRFIYTAYEYSKNQVSHSDTNFITAYLNDFASYFNVANIIWILIAIVIASIAIPRNYTRTGGKSMFLR